MMSRIKSTSNYDYEQLIRSVVSSTPCVLCICFLAVNSSPRKSKASMVIPESTRLEDNAFIPRRIVDESDQPGGGFPVLLLSPGRIGLLDVLIFVSDRLRHVRACLEVLLRYEKER